MDIDPSNSSYMDIQPEESDGDSDLDSEVNVHPRTRLEILNSVNIIEGIEMIKQVCIIT